MSFGGEGDVWHDGVVRGTQRVAQHAFGDALNAFALLDQKQAWEVRGSVVGEETATSAIFVEWN